MICFTLGIEHNMYIIMYNPSKGQFDILGRDGQGFFQIDNLFSVHYTIVSRIPALYVREHSFSSCLVQKCT